MTEGGSNGGNGGSEGKTQQAAAVADAPKTEKYYYR